MNTIEIIFLQTGISREDYFRAIREETELAFVCSDCRPAEDEANSKSPDDTHADLSVSRLSTGIVNAAHSTMISVRCAFLLFSGVNFLLHM